MKSTGKRKSINECISHQYPPRLSCVYVMNLKSKFKPEMTSPGSFDLYGQRLPRWPSGKASASREEDPGFESRLRRDFFGVESYQWLPFSGYPARRLAL